MLGLTAEEATDVLFTVENYLSHNNMPVPLLLICGHSDFDYPPLAISFDDEPWIELPTLCHAIYTAAAFDLFAARCKAANGNSESCQTSGRIHFLLSAA